MCQLLVDLFHAFYVVLTLLDVVDHGHGVVPANDTTRRSLHTLRRRPGFMDILGWEVLEYWEVCSGWQGIGGG